MQDVQGGTLQAEGQAESRAGGRIEFKRRALVLGLLTAVTAAFLGVFGAQAIMRIQTVEERWAAYSQDAAEADRLLHGVVVQMGYGGFIHNFKNYILRRDPEDLERLKQNRADVEDALAALQGRIISGEEQDALATVHAAMQQYETVMERAQRAFERGLSSAEVDILADMDDAPMLGALATLERSFQARGALAQEETDKALKTAASMVVVLLLVVPVIILLGVMLMVFLRRMVEANLKLGEVRDELGTLLSQAPDAILQVGQDGQVLRVNDQAVRLFGYPREEFLTLKVEQLIPQALRGGHVRIREQAFTGMKARPVGDGAALVALTRDGRQVPVEISINFITSGGQRIATAIVRDVTERKMAEEALQNAHDVLEKRVLNRTGQLLRRTEQLEAEIAERERAEKQLLQSAKMATIGEMASGITHELNQPMNIIRMGVEAAQIRIQRGQADIGQLSETLRKVEEQIVRMSDIVTHMRAYARLDNEGRAPFDPARAVHEGCKLFAAQLKGDDVLLEVEVPERAPAVLGHATRLEQVVLNLLSNARDAVEQYRRDHPGAGPGRIRVVLREDGERNQLVLTVEDSGGGVPEDVMPHIFAPFVTTKESGRGTGLGLSISFGIVQGMEGVIDVTNAEGGARFTVQLPIAAAAQEAAPSPAPAEEITAGTALPLARPGGIGKVLVVDDEVGAAHSLADFLQEMGYLVYTAYNGEEALHLFDSDPADAVITDMRMPVMGGEELVRALRERVPELPIFIMTGHGAQTGADGAQMEGVREIWRKPLSLTEVARKLRAFGGAA